MMYQGYLLPLGSPIPTLTPADADLAGLLDLIPPRLYPLVPDALAGCMGTEPPSMAAIGKVANLAALTCNAECIGAVDRVRRSGLPASGLLAELEGLAQLTQRQHAAEAALRELLPGDSPAYAAFVELGIAYDTLKTYTARVAYQVGSGATL